MKFPDLPAILAVIALAPLLLLAPGYFWSRLLDPGSIPAAERACWSLTLSLATAPILAYNFFLLVPYNAVTIWMFALSQTALPALLVLVFVGRPPRAAAGPPAGFGASSPTSFSPLWILPTLMALLVLTCLIDVERGALLYRSYPTGDYHKHILVTDAIHRTGIHPVNPAFHPGRPLPLFFYFFWFHLCSLVDGLSLWRLGPRAAVEGMTVWAAAGLFAIVLLLARRFLRPCSSRTIRICWALLFATGLDLVGFLISAFVRIEPGHAFWHGGPIFPGAVDSWNWDGQVTSWFETILWVPHHLAAAVISMTGLLLVFGATPKPARGPTAAQGRRDNQTAEWTRVFLFSAAAASSLGMSVWVTLVFCVFWLVWAAIAAWRGWREDLKLLLQAAIPAMLLALPFIWILSHARLDTRPPLILQVRTFSLWHDYSAHLRLGNLRPLLDLLSLAPAYFLEFGIFFLGGLIWWKHRRRPLDKAELALTLLAAISLLMTSVLRSNIKDNDFGWRGTLPAQFVLLLWTAWSLERLWRARRRPVLIIACLVIGFGTVAYDWAWMRVYPIAMDLLHHQAFGGRHNWTLRRLYEQVRRETSPGTIVQQNPNVWIEPYHSFNANRQTVVLDLVNGALFGTRGPLFDATLKEVASMFDRDAGAEQISAIARKYNIGVLVVKDTDPAWHSHVWDDRSRFRLVAQCEFARAYRMMP